MKKPIESRLIGRTLVDYKVPTDLEIVETLPKTIVGKVLRRELRG